MYDLFAGSGIVARRVRLLGCSAREFDARNAPNQDLCQGAVQATIAADAARGRVRSSMLAPPCGSLSQANRRAMRLRPTWAPWGRLDLNAEDRAFLAPGNRTTRAALRLMRTFTRWRIPFILEQPVGSRFRHLPELHRLVRAEPTRFEEVVLDQCAYGAPYQKRTWLLLYRIEDSGRLRAHRPCTARHGVCSHTGLPHVELVGAKMTAPAAHYPLRRGDALARALTSGAAQFFFNR